ncbi:MAG: hypothetical protein AB7K24_31210, partial [Gemmataceae bacterium]
EPDRLVVERMAISRSIDSVKALHEAIAQLQPVELPGRAIVVTPEVIPAVLELPVDPAKPRAAAQMLDLVRWEMETYLAQYAPARQIGDILIGRGHLTADQVREVLQEVEKRKRDSLISRTPGDRRTVSRFGDTAVELGLIERAQLEECLNLQESMHAGEEDYCYSYAGQPGAPGAEGRHPWLVACVHRAVRDRWEQAFGQEKLRLDGLYPLVGTASAAMPEENARGSSGILELQAGLVAATRVQDGVVVGMQIHYTAGRSPGVNTYVDLLGHDARGPIWLAGRHAHLRNLPRELPELLHRETDFIQMPIESASPETRGNQAAMLGAYASATGRAGAKRALGVPARDPAPPLWQRPQMHVAAVVSALVLLVGSVEMSLAKWKKRLETDKPVLDQLAQRKRLAEDAKAKLARAKQIQADITKSNKELELARADADHFEGALHRKVFEEWRKANLRRICLEKEVPRRGKLVPAMLDAMAKSAGGDVAVEKIVEKDIDEISVFAWSLDETSAQRFAQALEKTLAPWEMGVVGVHLRSAKGRLDLEGFEFEIKLGRLPPEAPAARSETRTLVREEAR